MDRYVGVAEQMRAPEEVATAYDAKTAKEPRSLARRILDNLGGSATSTEGTQAW